MLPPLFRVSFMMWLLAAPFVVFIISSVTLVSCLVNDNGSPQILANYLQSLAFGSTGSWLATIPIIFVLLAQKNLNVPVLDTVAKIRTIVAEALTIWFRVFPYITLGFLIPALIVVSTNIDNMRFFTASASAFASINSGILATVVVALIRSARR